MGIKTSNENRDAPSAPPLPKRRNLWLVGVIAVSVALIVFAAGAFAAGRLSAPSREGEDEGFFGQRPDFQIESAQELPTTEPTVRGIVTQRAGNTLTVGQRNGFFGPGQDGNTTPVDVVVTSDTRLYHDITQAGFNGEPPSGPVQQKVEPGALDDINANSRVTVWGDSAGDQITAKVLVYSDPFAFQPPQQ